MRVKSDFLTFVAEVVVYSVTELQQTSPLQYKQHLLVHDNASCDYLVLMTKGIMKISTIKKQQKIEQKQVKTIGFLSTTVREAGVVRGRHEEKLCELTFWYFNFDFETCQVSNKYTIPFFIYS